MAFWVGSGQQDELSSAPRKELSLWTKQEVITAMNGIPNLKVPSSARTVVNRLNINGAYLLAHDPFPIDVGKQMFSAPTARRQFANGVKKWKLKRSNTLRIRTSNGRKGGLIHESYGSGFNLRSSIRNVKAVLSRFLSEDLSGAVLRDSSGNELLDGNTLTNHSIQWGNEVFVDLNPKRVPSGIPGVSLTTSRPDVITMEDTTRFPRAQMGCGHAISADSMTLHIRDSLRRRATEIFCPDGSCRALWDWNVCKRVACVTRGEDREFEEGRQQNQASLSASAKACPHCGFMVMRQSGVDHARVRCVSCSGRDWCWRCLQPWTVGGFERCGNRGCDTEILFNCETHTIGSGSSAIVVPSVRSCPNCESLVFHKSNCKHMDCPSCSVQFCLSCLKTKPAGVSWSTICGGAFSACPTGIAPKRKV